MPANNTSIRGLYDLHSIHSFEFDGKFYTGVICGISASFDLESDKLIVEYQLRVTKDCNGNTIDTILPIRHDNLFDDIKALTAHYESVHNTKKTGSPFILENGTFGEVVDVLSSDKHTVYMVNRFGWAEPKPFTSEPGKLAARPAKLMIYDNTITETSR